MAEAADQLCLVQAVRGGLHPPHRHHSPVHVEESLFLEIDFEWWRFAVVGLKRALREVDGDTMSRRCRGKRATKLRGNQAGECKIGS